MPTAPVDFLARLCRSSPKTSQQADSYICNCANRADGGAKRPGIYLPTTLLAHKTKCEIPLPLVANILVNTRYDIVLFHKDELLPVEQRQQKCLQNDYLWASV